MTLNCFYTDEPPKGSRFVAISADGSSAGLFLRDDAGKYRDAEGDLILYNHWFADSGYLHYILLPDDYRLFFEGFERCFVK